MFEPNLTMENATRFSRLDTEHPLSSVSAHPFELEERVWLTAEHYYQAHKFENLPYADAILATKEGVLAHELGNKWLKKKTRGWKEKRRLWMTRALYRKAIEYPEVREALLATGDELLIETSLYNHFWGIGRDQRGENTLGKIWMDIRTKLQNEVANSDASQ